jgi:hypothetical protein
MDLTQKVGKEGKMAMKLMLLQIKNGQDQKDHREYKDNKMVQEDKDLVDSEEEFLKDNLKVQKEDLNGLKSLLLKDK